MRDLLHVIGFTAQLGKQYWPLTGSNRQDTADWRTYCECNCKYHYSTVRTLDCCCDLAVEPYIRLSMVARSWPWYRLASEPTMHGELSYAGCSHGSWPSSLYCIYSVLSCVVRGNNDDVGAALSGRLTWWGSSLVSCSHKFDDT